MWFTEAGGDNIGRVSTGAVWHVDMTAGNGQSATVNTAFANALQATATDADGDSVAGATITFTAPDSGAGATFADGTTTASATTDVNGLATSPALRANATAGAYTVTASADFASTEATFDLTNTAVIAPTATTPTTTIRAVLPVTGAPRDVTPLTLLGIGLVMIGATALAASRRRKLGTRSRPS